MLPELMMRIWDGDPDERFTFMDMRRVCYNANILARELGVPQVDFHETRHEDQFDYTEAQRLEDLHRSIGEASGLSLPIEPSWGVGRGLSFADFERWESNAWEVYSRIGGVGSRIPSDKFLHTVNAVLFADEWRGDGPYYMDLDVPMVYASSEALAFLSETADVFQQTAAFNALLQVVHLGDRMVRVYAHAFRPRVNIPIKMTSRPFEMYKQVTLPSASWTGNGPWTQTVDIGSTVANAVIGSDERNSTAQMDAMAAGIIGVSAVNGTRITVRAVGEKPTVDLYATVMFSAGSVS